MRIVRFWELDEKQCKEAKRDAAIPISDDGDFEKCVKYNLIGIVFYPEINTTDYTNHTISCSDRWDYDNSQYESTRQYKCKRILKIRKVYSAFCFPT